MNVFDRKEECGLSISSLQSQTAFPEMLNSFFYFTPILCYSFWVNSVRFSCMGKTNGIIFCLPKNLVPWEGPQIQASATLWKEEG